MDNQDFIQFDKDDNIYFVNSEGDEYAQIRYEKDYKWCYIFYELMEDICSLFSMGEDDSKEIIGKWVENTLQMEVEINFESMESHLRLSS